MIGTEYNKSDLLKDLNEKCGLADGIAEYVAETLFGLMLEKLEQHGRIELHEAFTLRIATVAAETGSIPRKNEHGETVFENWEKPERLKIKIKPSVRWKNYIATKRGMEVVG